MRWPQIRAGLIALAIVIGLVDGMPLPSRAGTPEWERGFVEPLRSARAAILWPVRGFDSMLRTTQRWALYQAPGQGRWRMWIEGAKAGKWELVYRSGDPEHTEDAWLLESPHVRGVWDIEGAAQIELPSFAEWITARVLANHPDFTGARVRMEKLAISHDGFVPTGEFEYFHIRVRK